MQIYTNQKLDYDDIIRFDKSDFKPLNISLSTYGYNSDIYYKENNIKFSLDTFKAEKQISLRSYIYNRIVEIEDETAKSVILKLVFNISNYELLNDFIAESGLSYFGLNLLIVSLLSIFTSKDKANSLSVLVMLMLVIVNPNFSGIRYFVYRFLSLINKDKFKALGLSILIILLIFPYKAGSISFLFPTILRIYNYTKKKSDTNLSIIIFLNSYFFSSISLIKIVLYKFLSMVNGLFIMLSYLFIWNNNLLALTGNIYFKITSFIELLNYEITGRSGIITIFLFFVIYKSIPDFKLKDLFIVSLLITLNVNNITGSVSFINVGHGDAILIKAPFNKETILIDTGSEANKNRLDIYLKAKGVRNIDYLLITHDDEDHCGNTEYLLNNYNVKNIITSKDDVMTEKFYIKQLNKHYFETSNGNSNCYLTKINSLTYLFTGDIDKNTERDILNIYNNLDIDVLKVAHHGSNTSSDNQFIKKISPIISVIQCSNKYNFPSIETINTLNSVKSRTYLTKADGDIEIYTLRNLNLLKTSKGEFVYVW